MDWIDISKQLPPKFTNVLVYLELYDQKYIEIAFMIPEDFFGKPIFEIGEMTIPSEEYNDKITHWMHLPDPPR